jgi:hypothetical protein
MKKLSGSASPFLLLLVPLFLIIGLWFTAMNNEIPAEKYQASIKLQVPSFKVMIQSVIDL